MYSKLYLIVFDDHCKSSQYCCQWLSHSVSLFSPVGCDVMRCDGLWACWPCVECKCQPRSESAQLTEGRWRLLWSNMVIFKGFLWYVGQLFLCFSWYTTHLTEYYSRRWCVHVSKHRCGSKLKKDYDRCISIVLSISSELMCQLVLCLMLKHEFTFIFKANLQKKIKI